MGELNKDSGQSGKNYRLSCPNSGIRKRWHPITFTSVLSSAWVTIGFYLQLPHF
jgi:hypothetical protein